MPKRIKPGKPLRESLASHHHQPEEEVLTYTQKLQAFVEGREVMIFSILAIVVLVGGGLGIVYFLRANAASLAAERVSVAFADYRRTIFGSPLAPSPTPPPWEPEMAAEKAQAIARVAEESEGTPAGTLGDYLAGNAYLRAGEPEKAIPLLEAADRKLAGRAGLGDFARQALAHAYEAAGESGKAQAAFERLAASTGASFRVEGLLGTARALWAQGKKQEAMQAYEKARAEFPEVVGSPPGPAPAPLDVKISDLGSATPAP